MVEPARLAAALAGVARLAVGLEALGETVFDDPPVQQGGVVPLAAGVAQRGGPLGWAVPVDVVDTEVVGGAAAGADLTVEGEHRGAHQLGGAAFARPVP